MGRGLAPPATRPHRSAHQGAGRRAHAGCGHEVGEWVALRPGLLVDQRPCRRRGDPAEESLDSVRETVGDHSFGSRGARRELGERPDRHPLRHADQRVADPRGEHREHDIDGATDDVDQELLVRVRRALERELREDGGLGRGQCAERAGNDRPRRPERQRGDEQPRGDRGDHRHPVGDGVDRPAVLLDSGIDGADALVDSELVVRRLLAALLCGARSSSPRPRAASPRRPAARVRPC